VSGQGAAVPGITWTTVAKPTSRAPRAPGRLRRV